MKMKHQLIFSIDECKEGYVLQETALYKYYTYLCARGVELILGWHPQKIKVTLSDSWFWGAWRLKTNDSNFQWSYSRFGLLYKQMAGSISGNMLLERFVLLNKKCYFKIEAI
jgi:hypothetical protein